MPSRFWSLSRALLGADEDDCETRTLAEVVFPVEAAPSPRDYLRACTANGCFPHTEVRPGQDGSGARPWRRPPAHLADPSILEELSESKSFSPSSLEAYLGCPFAWFVNRVIGVEELEPELDARFTGQLLHSVLSAVYRELAIRAALPVQQESLADAELLANAVIERQVGEEGCPGNPAEKKLTAWRLRKMVRRLLQIESEAGGSLIMLETESPVGGGTGIDIGGLKVRGRIDRIDTDPSGRSLFVLDYKSGGVPDASKIGTERALQLPLYLMALAAERPGEHVIGGAYLSPRDGRYSGVVRAGFEQVLGADRQGCRVLDPEELDTLLEEARVLSCEAAAGMRAGSISPKPDRECPAWCGLGPACRARRGGYRP